MTRQPLRLLMILHSYFPDDPRASAQARTAIDAGFEVDVVALRRKSERQEEEVGGVRIRRLGGEHRHGTGFAAMAAEYLSFTLRAALASARLARRRRYQVVEVHNPPDFLVLAAIGPRLLGARLVLDVHDLASDMFSMRFEHRPGARLADRILRMVERWAARTSSAVLTVHEPYRQELVARGVPGEKVTVVMNSLDERLLPTSPPARDSSAFRVVYHGTVTPHYGVTLIVEALALLHGKIPELEVQIYGEGDAIPALRSLADSLGVSDALWISDGFLPRDQVLRAAQGASAGVIPNFATRLNRFALSTKLFEYVALGVPVVSSDLPTIRRHFSDDEVLYFRPGDPTALAAALSQVQADPERTRLRVAAARARYEEYRWERSARAYVEVLRAAADVKGERLP